MSAKARGKQKASPTATEETKETEQDEGGGTRGEDAQGEGNSREGGDVEIDKDRADEIEVVCLLFIKLEIVISYII